MQTTLTTVQYRCAIRRIGHGTILRSIFCWAYLGCGALFIKKSVSVKKLGNTNILGLPFILFISCPILSLLLLFTTACYNIKNAQSCFHRE